MRRLGILLAFLTTTALAGGPRPASAGAAAARIAAALGGKPEHPHLIGTVMFFARWFHPGGTSGLHLSLFTLPAAATARDLDGRAEAVLGRRWSRMVRTVEAHGQEQTDIYIHSHGRRNFDMLIVNLDADGELSIIRLVANPQRLVEAADRGN